MQYIFWQFTHPMLKTVWRVRDVKERDQTVYSGTMCRNLIVRLAAWTGIRQLSCQPAGCQDGRVGGRQCEHRREICLSDL